MDYISIKNYIIRKNDIVSANISTDEKDYYYNNVRYVDVKKVITIKTKDKIYTFNYKGREGEKDLEQADIDFMHLFKDLNQKGEKDYE